MSGVSKYVKVGKIGRPRKEKLITLPKRVQKENLGYKRMLGKNIPSPICNSGSPTGSHHWIIDNMGLGICKYCGEKRQFVT